MYANCDGCRHDGDRVCPRWDSLEGSAATIKGLMVVDGLDHKAEAVEGTLGGSIVCGVTLEGPASGSLPSLPSSNYGFIRSLSLQHICQSKKTQLYKTWDVYEDADSALWLWNRSSVEPPRMEPHFPIVINPLHCVLLKQSNSVMEVHLLVQVLDYRSMWVFRNLHSCCISILLEVSSWRWLLIRLSFSPPV